MEVDLPFGPWKEIFSGDWSGFDIVFCRNSDNLTLTIIYEKEKGKVTGMVFVLNKYYTAEGDPSRLATALGGYNIIFDKLYPSFKRKYLILSSGPKYSGSGREDMASTIEDMFDVMNDQSERASALSKSFAVNLVELKYAKEEEISELFAEPILMPGLNVAQIGERQVARVSAKVLLGKKTTGEKAEENVQSFLSAIIVGDREERKKMTHMMIENCVLGGVTAVVFDCDKAYERMATPNKNFDFKAFPDIQPIGLPLKAVSIQEVGIDLNMMTPEILREIMGIVPDGKEYAGRVAAELIDQVFSENREQLTSLTDLEEKLLAIKDEVKKFHVSKSIRILKVLEMAYPDFFGGKVDLALFISPYLKSIGSVVRMDLSGLPDEMKAALEYSVITSLYRKYKAETATQEVKIICFIVDGDKIAPNAPGTDLQKGMLGTLTDCTKYGVGICLGTEHELDLNQEIIDKATIRLDSISEGEVAVREIHSRPYRMRMRSSLSA